MTTELNMRDLINIFEADDDKTADDVDFAPPADKKDMPDKASPPPPVKPQVSDAEKLAGAINPRRLAELLPAVDDETSFSSAIRKVRNGVVETLTTREIKQLALAFVSLMRDDRNDTQKAMAVLGGMHRYSE